MRGVRIEPTFESWRAAAKKLLDARIVPADVQWIDEGAEQQSLALPSAEPTGSAADGRSHRVPRSFFEAAGMVSAHRAPRRWDLLYRILWRLDQGEHGLLGVDIDEDVADFRALERQVKRDLHHLHAFVRFRRIETEGGEQFVAWHSPEHRVLRLGAPFFARRFAAMRWSILTPDESAHWDTEALTFGAGSPRSAAPSDDELESMWRTYYAATFNPARVNPALLKAQLPMRHWATLPESSEIAALIADAPSDVGAMVRTQRSAPTAAPYVPESGSIELLRRAAESCEGCDLHEAASQTVFGTGPADAAAVFVGEQPGDTEDRAGLPFVGPAGEVLNAALRLSGWSRQEIYLTNAVKHFSFEERGAARIHKTPRQTHIVACRPWLDAELAALRPRLIVALGATAARSLFGGTFRLMEQRGTLFASSRAPQAIATIHPSAVLRADNARRSSLFDLLVRDLRAAREGLTVSA